MDFGTAAMLVASVFVVVELVGRLVPTLGAREKVAIAIVAGQLSAFLTASSDWGPKQVVDGIPLDSMNAASLILVGLALAGLAVGLKQGLQSIANVGENQKTLGE